VHAGRSDEPLPLRIFWRFEARMPLWSDPGPALSSANFRTSARSHRSAYRSAGGGISRRFERAGGGKLAPDSRTRRARATKSTSALCVRRENQLQRANDNAPVEKPL